jgi:hypothetical protein
MKKNVYMLIAVVVAMAVVVFVQYRSDSLDRKALDEFREGCDFESVGIAFKYLSGKKIDREKTIIVSDREMVCSIWKAIAEAEIIAEKKKKLYDIHLYIAFNNRTLSYTNIFEDYGSNRVVGSLHTGGQDLSIAFDDENNIIGKLLTAYGIPP